jgi:hypothetical protein
VFLLTLGRQITDFQAGLAGFGGLRLPEQPGNKGEVLKTGK